ncbi:unnamed protein product [Haemonchus placei]|uniref:Uncharacterized protein n=1 Tax=Haemonchus placei TaxID=6290 RepID=A0A158QP44_HAEPC|nr:unnamed protein product [Haemonchus placei]
MAVSADVNDDFFPAPVFFFFVAEGVEEVSTAGISERRMVFFFETGLCFLSRRLNLDNASIRIA